jgi:hypothetical protein
LKSSGWASATPKPRRTAGRSARAGSFPPWLLVRDARNGKLVIADGYHRMCSIYSFDEDAVIARKIA